MKFLVDNPPLTMKFMQGDILEKLEYKWLNTDNEDGYTHHCCGNCGIEAISYPVMVEDFDEDYDGELYLIGFIQTGIHEFLTPYCPYCGVKLSIDDSSEDFC